MITTQASEKPKREAVNLNLTPDIADWLKREASRLMTSKAVVARIALEKAMRESEEQRGAA